MHPKKTINGQEDDGARTHVLRVQPPMPKPDRTKEESDAERRAGDVVAEVGTEVRTAVMGPKRQTAAVTVEDAGVVEDDPVTPLTVHARACRMGIHLLPGAGAALDAEYETPEAFADALCACLKPYEQMGLTLAPVRTMLLLSPHADVTEVCRRVGGRTFVNLGPCGKGGVGATFFAAEAGDTAKLLIMKRVDVKREGGVHDNSYIQAASHEPELLRAAGELVACEAEDDGRTFTQHMVMPFHEGPSIQSLLKSSPDKRLPPKVACWLALCVARELKRLGDVWHLDVKGDNVMVGPDLRAKLIDFGAGRIAPRNGGTSVDLGMVVTHTPQLSAPEVAVQGMAAPTSDTYSLLLLLYQMLSGEHVVPDHLVAKGLPMEAIFRGTNRYKLGKTREGPQGLLVHVNTGDKDDPAGQNRSKIRQVTDWHQKDTEYADAGTLVRELFHDALQNDPGRRPSVDRLVHDLRLVCARLGVDPERGPELGDVKRDETLLVGRQITPLAILDAVKHGPGDKYLRRVDVSHAAAADVNYEGAA